MIFDAPFELYQTFVLEERWGYNKTTKETWIEDKLKGLLLNCVFTTLLLAGLTKIILWAGEQQFYYYCTGFGMVFFIFIQLLFPNFIGPMFYKFTNLGENPDETMRERELELLEDIKEVAKEVNFPLGKTYVIDGSKRSAHSNAFFFGICGKKMVVLFDTLLHKDDEGKNKQENSEIAGILCHEFGHWYYQHNIVNMAVMFTMMFTFLKLSQFFLFELGMYLSFGCMEKDILIGLILFMPLLTPVMKAFSLINVKITRMMEFQADRFALRFKRQDALVRALVKLFKSSKADLDPDPLYATLNFSHPTLIERIRQLDELTKKDK